MKLTLDDRGKLWYLTGHTKTLKQRSFSAKMVLPKLFNYTTTNHIIDCPNLTIVQVTAITEMNPNNFLLVNEKEHQ